MCQKSQWKKTETNPPPPQQRLIVLVKTGYGGRWTTIAEYLPKCTVLAEDVFSDDCCPYSCDIGEDGEDFMPEGWYEDPIDSEMVFKFLGEIEYWMEIPEPPVTKAQNNQDIC